MTLDDEVHTTVSFTVTSASYSRKDFLISRDVQKITATELRVLQQGLASIGWGALPERHEDRVAAERLMSLISDAIETAERAVKR